MRRFLFGVVIASVTAAMPVSAFGGDREIAKTVMGQLEQHQSAGRLKGFDIDMKVEGGVVYFTGEVASSAQLQIVEAAAREAVGSQNVVNEIRVKQAAPRRIVKQQPVKLQPAKQQAVKRTAVKPASSTQRSAKPSRADIAVTDSVIAKLQQSKAAGKLRGFELDVSTVSGDVWLRGKVANAEQKNHIIETARRIRGVARVIDDITITGDSAIRPASTTGLVPAGIEPGPVPVPVSNVPVPVSSMPVANPGAPQPMAPSGLHTVNAGEYGMTPVPMQGSAVSYGTGAPRYDQPNMPGYAWPSYAAYPNYGAVTYPKQYSPSAWPYIGPFYPYPQVPLGWRKVALEWDDGLWYLDFTSK
ncbi:MAG TPA: BON domain-containing protein [Planctomycetaceae bacterium]|nr:BON domain-containing protein [Planctomycetaceae bacterium]